MISVKTKFTKKVYSDFASYYIKKNKSINLIYICSSILILCGIATILLNEITEGIIFIVLAVLFALYSVFVYFLIISSNKKNIGMEAIYEFEDTKLTVKSIDKEGKEICSNSINYNVFHSIKTYKNYCYIFVNKLTAYIILKENFANENQFNLVINNIKNNIVKKS